MAGISCGKDTWVTVFALKHIIKAIGNAVANIVNRPPDYFFHIQRIGTDDAVSRSNHVVLSELAMCCFFIRAEFVELDIHAKHIATFTGQDQHIAFFGRRDQTLLAHIGKIGVGQNVHHTPSLVRCIAM